MPRLRTPEEIVRMLRVALALQRRRFLVQCPVCKAKTFNSFRGRCEVCGVVYCTKAHRICEHAKAA